MFQSKNSRYGIASIAFAAIVALAVMLLYPSLKNDVPANKNTAATSEADIKKLMAQIQNCWDPPTNLKTSQIVPVVIKVEVNPDHTIREARIADEMRASKDNSYLEIANSALEALNKPECKRLDLPVDGYEDWKDIVLTFDLRDRPKQ